MMPENKTVPAQNTLQAQLDALRTFVARRFDELSMEVNAASQQMDMAESGMAGRLSEIMETLAALSFQGGDAAPANVGVDLHAVVETTEDAANRILDAAERIAGLVQDDGLWHTPEIHASLREALAASAQDIVIACTFQDLAGQRIGKTLESLRTIEDRLGATLEKLGIPTEIDRRQAAEKAIGGNLATQSDIDNLF